MTATGIRIAGSADEQYVEVPWLHYEPVLAAWSPDHGWTVAASPQALHRSGLHGGLDRNRLLATPLPADWPLGFASYEYGTSVLANGEGYLLGVDGTLRTAGSLQGGLGAARPLDADGLEQFLRAALRRLRGRTVGLMLSGGLDSALLAALLVAEAVPFTAACVANRDNPEDVSSAEALCTELGIPLLIVTPSLTDYVESLPLATSAFGDARPDVFRALGLVFAGNALGNAGCDVIVGGEPADDVLQSSRVFFEAGGSGGRAFRWRECLRDTIPRSLHLLRQAAAAAGADAAAPYADPLLVAAAAATDWALLQSPDQVRSSSGGGLGGPGFKPLQKEVARRLESSALNDICRQNKLGLPHASQSHWLALKNLVLGANDTETFTRLWTLSGALYEWTVCLGKPPDAVPTEQVIARISRGAGDIGTGLEVNR